MRFSDRLLGRWLPVAALTVVGAAAAAVFAYTAANRYDATSQLIVSPVSASDPTYLGLGLLRDTGGKRTAAASAAVLLRSPQVADAVRTQLGLTRSRDSLLAALHAHAAAGSDIVDVTVRDTSAVRAAQLANAFASALVAQRTVSFQSQLTSVIRRVRQQLLALPPNQRSVGTGAALQQRLTVLESLQGQPDPTIRPADQAEAPSSPAWPNRPLIVGAGAGAGLLLGLVVAGIVVLVRRKPRLREASPPAAPPAPAGPSPELRRLEQELEERSVAVAAREEQVDARNEEIERRTTELEERAHALERRTGELETRTESQIEEANAREVEARKAAERAAEERAAAEARAAEEREAREREAVQREQAERERAEREQAEREAREREAAEREQAERDAAEREAREREAAGREQVERERAEQEQAEREARERAAAEREAAEREQTERERAEQERAEREAAEREARERAERSSREQAEREAAEREDAERRAAIRAPAPLPLEPVLAGVPAYRPAGPTNGGGRGHWNLVELERLVEERGGQFPDRLDEWESYLFFLRDYAEPDGSVPASFDWLIEDEFAEIV